MPVVVQVNKKPIEPWHINMMPTGKGGFYLYLHGDVRKASNTKVGDLVLIELDFDEQYRNGPQHSMPKEFARALSLNTVARQNWDNLSPSRQKEILRYLANLKTKDALNRNIKKALLVLSGADGRFMARSWHDGA
jgi:hypothetical protein